MSNNKGSKRKYCTFFLLKELDEKLKTIAKQRGTSKNKVVESLIEKHL